jgi:rubrerythrin
MVGTSENFFSELWTAFAADAMTVQRYTYFAQVAEIEGHVKVSKLFAEFAESIACAAQGHIDFLQYAPGSSIGCTQLNLTTALAGELQEAMEIYPRLVSVAHDEGLADVASWLETLAALKRAHFAKIDHTLATMVPNPSMADDATSRADVRHV